MAVRSLTDGDTASDVLAEFFGFLDSFGFDVKSVYVDSEFYDEKCLTLMQAHDLASVRVLYHLVKSAGSVSPLSHFTEQQTRWGLSDGSKIGEAEPYTDTKRWLSRERTKQEP